MSIDPSILDDLSPRGSAVKWEKVGDVRKVVIESAVKRQTSDFKTGLPEFWDDGKPKEQLVISGTDPETGEKCTMYLKHWGNTKRAFIAALAGRPLEVGATLAVKWEGEEEPTKPGLSPARTWKMRYEPPAPVALDAEDLF